MLLANKSVAKYIHDSRVDSALLVRQPPPKDEVIENVIAKWKDIGIEIEGGSIAELHVSRRDGLLRVRYINKARVGSSRPESRHTVRRKDVRGMSELS